MAGRFDLADAHRPRGALEAVCAPEERLKQITARTRRRILFQREQVAIEARDPLLEFAREYFQQPLLQWIHRGPLGLRCRTRQQGLELLAHLVEVVRGLLGLPGGCKILATRVADVSHRRLNLADAEPLLTDRGRDLGRGPRGLRYRIGELPDGAAGLVHRLDRTADALAAFLGRHDSPGGRLLYLSEYLPDLGGGLLGLVGQRLDSARDHREAAAVLAGPRSLDCGIEGQQVGLFGDVVDRGDDLADRMRLLGKPQDALRDGLRTFLYGIHGRHRVRNRLATTIADLNRAM